MQQIINFLIRNKHFILFIFLLAVALAFTFQSNSFHRSKFINSSNWFSGSLYQTNANISEYFNLKEENKKLFQENTLLRNSLFNLSDTINTHFEADSTSYLHQYKVISGKVINNSFSKAKNYLTINKGKKDNVIQDVGVISSNGIVGIIESVSTNYSTAQSILNSLSKINAKLKNTNHFGTLIWNTKNPNIVQLIDIPRLAPVKIGDTVITGGMSAIFPEGIPIGHILDYHFNESRNYYIINVTLFNDMTNLKHIYLIKNLLKKEQDSLEALLPNE